MQNTLRLNFFSFSSYREIRILYLVLGFHTSHQWDYDDFESVDMLNLQHYNYSILT